MILTDFLIIFLFCFVFYFVFFLIIFFIFNSITLDFVIVTRIDTGEMREFTKSLNYNQVFVPRRALLIVSFVSLLDAKCLLALAL